MNEIRSFLWFKVLSNFVWILGAALVLAAFSYIDFIAFIKKTKRSEIVKNNELKLPFFWGSILVAIGMALSAHNLWLTVLAGSTAFLFTFRLPKIMKKHKRL